MTCRPYWCVLGHVPMYSAIDTSEVCIFTILYGQGLQGLPDPLLLCMYIHHQVVVCYVHVAFH